MSSLIHNLLSCAQLQSHDAARSGRGAPPDRGVTTSAAESLYAAYRMPRLGIIVMDLWGPIPFRVARGPERHLVGRQRAGAPDATQQRRRDDRVIYAELGARC